MTGTSETYTAEETAAIDRLVHRAQVRALGLGLAEARRHADQRFAQPPAFRARELRMQRSAAARAADACGWHIRRSWGR